MMIRVLIAEDEPPTLRRMKRMVEEAGLPFEVVATAFDGEEALKKLQETPCDVVFTDIKMPVMDGLKLMDSVRENHPDCFLVVISGYQDFDYAAHALRANAVDYLLKPVSQTELLPVLSRLMQKVEAQRRQNPPLPTPRETDGVSQENVAKQVRDYLGQHYREAVNTQTLGEVFGYVPSYLSVLFSREYGISPSDYLVQIRLSHAKELLKAHPDMLVKEIAEQVGFKNPHHFSKTFKKHEGVWPTDYAP